MSGFLTFTCHGLEPHLDDFSDSCLQFTVLSLLLFSGSALSDSATPWTAAHQAPLLMGFSRQESWSGLLGPSPGDLPHLGSNPYLLPS